MPEGLALRERSEFNECEIVIERPDGSRVTALAHASPVHGPDGGLLGAVNLLVDITDRKHMEDELQRIARENTGLLETLREANERKDEFLAPRAPQPPGAGAQCGPHPPA